MNRSESPNRPFKFVVLFSRYPGLPALVDDGVKFHDMEEVNEYALITGQHIHTIIELGHAIPSPTNQSVKEIS